jgi:hypothetical protein
MKTVAARRLAGSVLLLTLLLTGSAASQTEEKSPWDWGVRFRARETYIVNPFDLNSDRMDDWHFMRFRTQLWGAYEPNEWWKAHAMLNNETRRWFKPKDGPTGEGFQWGEVIFESLFLQGKKLNYTPFGFKIGRQNIFYGDGFICWDGGPLDGSRTAYFNAVLLQGDWEKRTLDLHFIANPQQDDFLVINDQDRYLIEWDEMGAGLYFTEKSFDGRRVEGYYFYKNENDPDDVHPESNIHTIGARATGRSWDAFDFGLEMASQVGDRGDQSRLAWAMNFFARYDVIKSVGLKPGLGGFAYSGDKPDTDSYEGWNPVYARWPKWSELYIYTLVNERGVAYWENMAAGFFSFGLDAHPRIHIDWHYYFMWAFEEAPDPTDELFGDGNFRGMLSTLKLSWNWTEYLTGHLLWETLMPGDYYAEKSNYSHFLRWEVYFRY